MFSRIIYEVPLPGTSVLRLGERTLLMGIVNVTPDSFSQTGRYTGTDDAVAAILRMEQQGADIVDIGGESTRPGAGEVGAEAELDRVLPVIRRVAARIRVPLSIDTYKAEVARVALAEGVSIVNDISGLRYDAELSQIVAGGGGALVLMHTRGRSRDMYRHAVYADVAGEIAAEISCSIEAATAAGVARERIIIDPGIGFAKRPGHSYEALTALPALAALDRPIAIGPSRKSFLQAALGDRPEEGRTWGTAAAVAAGVLFGAHIVRVHDVPEMSDVVRVADKIREAMQEQ